MVNLEVSSVLEVEHKRVFWQRTPIKSRRAVLNHPKDAVEIQRFFFFRDDT